MECGFYIDRSVLEVNMTEQSFISKRLLRNDIIINEFEFSINELSILVLNELIKNCFMRTS